MLAECSLFSVKVSVPDGALERLLGANLIMLEENFGVTIDIRRDNSDGGGDGGDGEEGVVTQGGRCTETGSTRGMTEVTIAGMANSCELVKMNIEQKVAEHLASEIWAEAR